MNRIEHHNTPGQIIILSGLENPLFDYITLVTVLIDMWPTDYNTTWNTPLLWTNQSLFNLK